MIALVNVAFRFQRRYYAHEPGPASASIIAGAEKACPPPA
jgi:hypothetical protein